MNARKASLVNRIEIDAESQRKRTDINYENGRTRVNSLSPMYRQNDCIELSRCTTRRERRTAVHGDDRNGIKLSLVVAGTDRFAASFTVRFYLHFQLCSDEHIYWPKN